MTNACHISCIWPGTTLRIRRWSRDAFLRSLFPGQAEPPAGLLIDAKGAHYDPAQPSELEELLRSHPLDDSHLLNRARACIERLP